MNLNRLTQKSQEAITEAQNKALVHGHMNVDGEHLLWALLDQTDGLVPKILQKMNVNVDHLKAELAAELEKRPSVSGPGVESDKIYISHRRNYFLPKRKSKY